MRGVRVRKSEIRQSHLSCWLSERRCDLRPAVVPPTRTHLARAQRGAGLRPGRADLSPPIGRRQDPGSVIVDSSAKPRPTGPLSYSCMPVPSSRGVGWGSLDGRGACRQLSSGRRRSQYFKSRSIRRHQRPGRTIKNGNHPYYVARREFSGSSFGAADFARFQELYELSLSSFRFTE
jgi:hypothetical protein